MEYRILGKTGFRVSALALGGNQIGSLSYGYRDDRTARDAVLKAIDLGINFFDTADVYGGGRSEDVLGSALHGHRDKVIIMTKGGLTGDGRRNGHPGHLKATIENSLIRLRTDYVDIFLLHAPDPKVPIEESLGAIDCLVSEGKVRFSGVSHANIDQLKKVAHIKSFAVAQDACSIFTYLPVADRVSYCISQNIGFSGHSPMASGLFSGRYAVPFLQKPVFTDRRFWNPDFSYLLRLAAIAQGTGATLPQLALAWAMLQKGVATVIMGTSSIGQLVHNVGSLGISLGEATLRDIDQLILERSAARHPIREVIWRAGHSSAFRKIAPFMSGMIRKD